MARRWQPLQLCAEGDGARRGEGLEADEVGAFRGFDVLDNAGAEDGVADAVAAIADNAARQETTVRFIIDLHLIK